MIMVGIPLFVEMDTVLQIWLNVHDPLTVSFSRYMVIYTIVLSLNNPISIIIQAAGYVKQYHLATEVLTLLCPIFTYVSFKMGFPAISTFFLMVVAHDLLYHVEERSESFLRRLGLTLLENIVQNFSECSPFS